MKIGLISNQLINLRKPNTRIIKHSKINAKIERYYSGNCFSFSLSLGTSQRILHLFNKNNLLKTNYSSDFLNKMTNDVFKIAGNRRDFFINIRRISKNEFIIPKHVVGNKEVYPTISALAEITRRMNLPQKREHILSAQQANKQEGLLQPLRSLSLEEKKELFKKNHDVMMSRFESLKITYEKNKVIDWNIIEEWSQYLQKRGNIEPHYTVQEDNVYNFLKQVFIENNAPKDVILAQLEDKLHALKTQSNLSNRFLFDKLPQTCFTEEDYKITIKAFKEVITLLETNTFLNNDALILLSIWSQAVTLDQDNKPKLTREVYNLMHTYPEEFGIKYNNNKPNQKEILQALKDKNYFINQSTDTIIENHVLSTAPLLHKTIIIPTKDGLYYTAMFTSAKTGTELLALTQEFALDGETTNKQQRFVVFSHFIKCDSNDSMIVDLAALGFSQANNLEGENVHEKIMAFYMEKQHIWGNNFIQELIVITPNVLKNISLIFYKKNLDVIEKKYVDLLYQMKNLPETDKQLYCEKLSKKRENELAINNQQKYLAALPENAAKLCVLLTFFEKEKERQQLFAEEIKEKLKIKELAADVQKKKDALKITEKENRRILGQMTATEKKEAYLKNKEKQAMITNDINDNDKTS